MMKKEVDRNGEMVDADGLGPLRGSAYGCTVISVIVMFLILAIIAFRG
jgi:hypothetical protein